MGIVRLKEICSFAVICPGSRPERHFPSTRLTRRCIGVRQIGSEANTRFPACLLTLEGRVSPSYNARAALAVIRDRQRLSCVTSSSNVNSVL